MSLNITNKRYAIVHNDNLNNQDIVVTTNGNYYAQDGYTGLGLVRVQLPEPVYEEVTISPKITAQTRLPGAGYNAISKVKVNAVTAAIDSNIKPENIVKGTSILGVEGTVEFITEDIVITPTTSVQHLTPTNDGFYNIQVNAVTSSIDSNIKTENIKSGVTILGVAGNLIPSNETTRNITINGTYTPPSPYTGFSEVVVDVGCVLEELTITPTASQQIITSVDKYHGYSPITVEAATSAIDPNLVAENIKQGVQILDIVGTLPIVNNTTKLINSNGTYTVPSPYTGFSSVTVDVNTVHNTDLTVTPTTTTQTYTPTGTYTGYGTVTVNPVTAEIDSDIVAGNIKKGVNILGVTGSYIGTLQSKTLTVNANTATTTTISPDSAYTGLSSVTVDLTWILNQLTALNAGDADTTINLQNKTFSSAGSYTCDAGYDGLGTVTVNLDWVDQAIAQAAAGAPDGTGDQLIAGSTTKITTDADTVRSYAFYYSPVEKVVLTSATSIGAYAFANSSLHYLTISTPQLCSLQSTSLSGTTITAIYVPSNLVSTYKSASNWSSYASKIQAIS